ncbi:MAG TPA: 4'-phosphopantetheinyl transferase superfamily protein [Kofleriaceae bacterium]|nr:4'-phosphopantetheinyl transferase superfamily protein [Kofleriaceae bacterium]
MTAGWPSRAWTLDLPHGRVVAVTVAAGAAHAGAASVVEPSPDVDDLHPDERLALAAIPPVRRPEWIAGRRALRAALVDVGGAAAAAHPLPSDDRGAPVTPAGLVGSISHKRAVAVALAAADEGARLGIDLEQLAPRRFDLSRRVLTAAELEAIASLTGLARDHAVLRAFALKEAVYKAIDPFLRRYIGFLEVAVWPSSDGTARVDSPAGSNLLVDAAWRLLDDHILCTARARPAPCTS